MKFNFKFNKSLLNKVSNTTLEDGGAKLGNEMNFATKEAYALLRTNLSFSLAGKGGGKKIGVTSSIPAEGKSTVSINLAYSLADAGNKVLLLDGDMRRPSLARKLKKRSTPGLSNYLAGDASSVVHTKVLSDNLDVIVSGDIPPNPSELMGSEKMEKTLNMLADKYDYLIVDLPPVSSVADPLIISKFLDGVIVVLRHEYTKSELVKETVHRLKFAHAHILGFVYNAHSRIGRKYYRKYSGRYTEYYKRSNSQNTENAAEAEATETLK